MKMPRAKMCPVCEGSGVGRFGFGGCSFCDASGIVDPDDIHAIIETEAEWRTLTEAKAVATETGSRFISGPWADSPNLE